jgi:hypothetical protein
MAADRVTRRAAANSFDAVRRRNPSGLLEKRGTEIAATNANIVTTTSISISVKPASSGRVACAFAVILPPNH